MDGGRRVDRDLFSLARLRQDRALLRRRRGNRRHPAHRSDQLDQIGDIIRPDVEHRPGAGLEEEIRIRMPVLHAVSHHEARAAGDFSHLAAVDEIARKLMRAAEEGVGRRADAQALFLRPLLQVQPLPDRKHEGLFRIDVLAGVEHLLRHRVMRGRIRQVDHDVDVGCGEQAVHRLRPNLVLSGAGPCRGHVDVRAGAHLDAAKQRRQSEIGRGDIAAADDADPQSLRHDRYPFASW